MTYSKKQEIIKDSSELVVFVESMLMMSRSKAVGNNVSKILLKSQISWNILFLYFRNLCRWLPSAQFAWSISIPGNDIQMKSSSLGPSSDHDHIIQISNFHTRSFLFYLGTVENIGNLLTNIKYHCDKIDSLFALFYMSAQVFHCEFEQLLMFLVRRVLVDKIG